MTTLRADPFQRLREALRAVEVLEVCDSRLQPASRRLNSRGVRVLRYLVDRERRENERGWQS